MTGSQDRSKMDSIDLFDTNSGFWPEIDEMDCPCKGLGWADCNGVMKTCSIHYSGQLHPDSMALLLDEPDKLKEEERKSNLKWKIGKCRTKIKELETQLKLEYESVISLELELVNRTATVKMAAASPPLEKSKKRSK
jgi:hypothetical protein